MRLLLALLLSVARATPAEDTLRAAFAASDRGLVSKQHGRTLVESSFSDIGGAPATLQTLSLHADRSRQDKLRSIGALLRDQRRSGADATCRHVPPRAATSGARWRGRTERFLSTNAGGTSPAACERCSCGAAYSTERRPRTAPSYMKVSVCTSCPAGTSKAAIGNKCKASTYIKGSVCTVCPLKGQVTMASAQPQSRAATAPRAHTAPAAHAQSARWVTPAEWTSRPEKNGRFGSSFWRLGGQAHAQSGAWSSCGIF